MMRPGRLDAKIYVPLPDAAARYRLLELYVAARPLADDVDLAALCDRLDGYSGADIASIAERAARNAFLESIDGGEARTINMGDLLTVLEHIRPSVSKSELARFERFAVSGE